MFPPTNKLLQYNYEQKQEIKFECKRLMEAYNDNLPNQSRQFTASSNIHEPFADFVDQTEDNVQSVDYEVESYEKNNIRLEDNFDVLKWWYSHKNEYPLLYKLSCKIFSTPATSAASERVFSQARCLISEKRCNLSRNDSTINHIMFLHENLDKTEESALCQITQP